MSKWQLVQKLASHFKISKDILWKDNPEDSDLLTFPTLADQVGLYTSFFPAECSKLNLGILLSSKKFIKSSIHEQFIIGESCVHPNKVGDYVMALYLTGILWFIYRADLYEGCGGVLVREGSKEGWVIEPCGNWLSHRFPKPDPED